MFCSSTHFIYKYMLLDISYWYQPVHALLFPLIESDILVVQSHRKDDMHRSVCYITVKVGENED